MTRKANAQTRQTGLQRPTEPKKGQDNFPPIRRSERILSNNPKTTVQLPVSTTASRAGRAPVRRSERIASISKPSRQLPGSSAKSRVDRAPVRAPVTRQPRVKQVTDRQKKKQGPAAASKVPSLPSQRKTAGRQLKRAKKDTLPEELSQPSSTRVFAPASERAESFVGRPDSNLDLDFPGQVKEASPSLVPDILDWLSCVPAQADLSIAEDSASVPSALDNLQHSHISLTMGTRTSAGQSGKTGTSITNNIHAQRLRARGVETLDGLGLGFCEDWKSGVLRRSIEIGRQTRVKEEDARCLAELAQQFARQYEAIGKEPRQSNDVDDLIEKFQGDFLAKLRASGFYTISKQDYKTDWKDCVGGNEAFLQRTIMMHSTDHWGLNNSFICLAEFQCMDEVEKLPVKANTNGGYLRNSKTDLVIGFRNSKFLIPNDPERERPPNDFNMYPSGNSKCWFPFLFMEVKKEGGDLAKGWLQAAQAASQGLYSIYLCMHKAGKLLEFFKHVRTFSVVLDTSSFTVRMHRGYWRDSEMQLEYTWEVLEKAQTYKRDQICNIIKTICRSYVEKDMHSSLQSTVKTLSPLKKTKNKAQAPRPLREPKDRVTDSSRAWEQYERDGPEKVITKVTSTENNLQKNKRKTDGADHDGHTPRRRTVESLDSVANTEPISSPEVGSLRLHSASQSLSESVGLGINAHTSGGSIE